MSSVSDVLKKFPEKFRNFRSASKQLPETVVVGFDNEIARLVSIIHSPQSSASDKVTAAGVIRASIEEHNVSSIQELWYSTRCLLEPDNQTEVRRAGWKLTASCITHDDMNNSALYAYYHATITYSNVEDLDLIILVLRLLTDNGKRILVGQTPEYQLPVVLISWIQVLAVRVQTIRSNKLTRDILEQWGSTSEAIFHELLSFTINTLKFNMVLYEEQNLENLLLCVVAIIRSTSALEDMSLCCTIIDTIMAFGILPVAVLQPVLEVLCGIITLVKELAETAVHTIRNLRQSHLGNSTVVRLYFIVESRDTEITNSMKIGAIKMLANLTLEEDAVLLEPDKTASLRNYTDLFFLPLYEIFSAFAASLADCNIRLASSICENLSNLLKNSNIIRKHSYGLWTTPEASPLSLTVLIGAMCLSPAERPRLLERLHWRQLQPIVGDEIEGNESTGRPVSAEQEQPAHVAELKQKVEELLSVLTQLLLDSSCAISATDVKYVCLDLSEFMNADSKLRLLEYIEKTHTCSPYVDGWKERFHFLMTHFYERPNTPASVRLKCLDMFLNAHRLSALENQDIFFVDILQRVLSIYVDSDEVTAVKIVEVLDYLMSNSTLSLFESLIPYVLEVFPNQDTVKIFNDEQSTRLELLARMLGRFFAKFMFIGPWRAKIVYGVLVEVCKRSKYDYNPFKEAFAILCRIRVIYEDIIVLTKPTVEPDYCRLAHSQVELDYLADVLEQPSLLIKNKDQHFVGKLPSQDDLREASTENTQLEQEIAVSNDKEEPQELKYSISVSEILALYLDILKNGAAEAVYGIVQINAVSQLANVRMFQGLDSDMLKLINILIQIVSTGKLPLETISAEGVTKQDYMSICIHLMAICVGYSGLLNKADFERIVQALVLNLNTWDKSANWSIHCLILCCYEFPSSVQRYLPQILNRFQTKISSKESSTHILEFLFTLSLVETLTDNFNLLEYKRVFGMCFSYIQSAYDNIRNSKLTADRSDSDISPYLLRLAYVGITYLFLALPVGSRPAMASYLVRNLILADNDERGIDPVGLTIIDMIARFSYSDLPLNLNSEVAKFSRVTDSEHDIKRWLLGTAILECIIHRSTGSGTLIVRRPTGTTVTAFKPAVRNSVFGHFSSGVENPLFYSANWLFVTLYMQWMKQEPIPIPIPSDAQSIRAISTLDRAPVLDFYKVGIIYIAPGQRDEKEILANSAGSEAYRKFLKGMGELIKLKHNRDFYVGGLDTEMDYDGEYAIGWRGKIMQLIYHTTTMMPNNPQDPSMSSKKRHIGNNFVNIYFDESNHEFDFDVVKSQFNFINILITPAFVLNRWKVRAYRKEGLANILAANELKVVSEEQLPQFVRHLAVKASIFATVYNLRGEYTDNWAYRLGLIQQLRDRLTKRQEDKIEESKETQEAESEAHSIEVLSWLDFSKFVL